MILTAWDLYTVDSDSLGLIYSGTYIQVILTALDLYTGDSDSIGLIYR